jgi:iron complex outermembrane receptor protein
MTNRNRMSVALATGAAWLALVPTFALAQTPTDVAPEQSSEAADDSGKADDIVVTGTLIRGIAPGGSQSIGVDQEKIAAIGATTTADLIADVPQAGNFLSFVGIRGSSNFQLAVNRPSLRYLGNQGASSATTLLLLDGHRMPGMGVLQSSPDLDAIAPGAIERVEIVPDGGSATYGSDAIGGVMNFVTRQKFDGIEARGSAGFADDYQVYTGGVTVGKVGNTWSAYVAYDYSFHDEIFGRDRDWSQNLDWVHGIGSSLACPTGSIQVGNGGPIYALPNLTLGLGNRCDTSEDSTIYPRETKHSAFGRIVFEPGGPASFAISAFYVHRVDESSGGPLGVATGLNISSSNPFAAPVLAALPGSPTTAKYFFDLSSANYVNPPAVTTMESYGITPTVKIDIGHDWQINALLNYGHGFNQFKSQGLSTTVLQTAFNNPTFNPFNLGAAGNGRVLTDDPGQALDTYSFGRAAHQMMNARIVADGPLFELPAGAVRAAVGAEYYWEKYKGNNSFTLTAAQLDALQDRTASREVKSVFGELSIPVLGDGHGPFHSLTLSAAGRYDDYSDFGHTFNPKLGVNFEPVDWLTIRGNWGKSFQAPGISDIALAGALQYSVLPLSVLPYYDPSIPPPASRPVFIAVGGTRSPLKPQTANTWTVGFEAKPPIVEGLSFGATYYNIDYKGVIGFPAIYLPSFYRDFRDKYAIFTDNGGGAAGNAALEALFNELAAAGTPGAADRARATIAGLGGFGAVYSVMDSRVTNLARIKTSGIDFDVQYRHETGFGDVYAGISGSYILTFKQQSNPTAAVGNALALDTTKLRATTTVGADIGNLRAQVVWNFSQGFDTTPTIANLGQDHVGNFNVFNLFFLYKVPSESAIFKDLSLTLNVDNVFDQDPPLFRGSSNSVNGVANGFTLGRLIKFGVTKKF